MMIVTFLALPPGDNTIMRMIFVRAVVRDRAIVQLSGKIGALFFVEGKLRSS
ncbi:MAG: hypothetical protein WHV44_07945 [Anaerolineales bacterium]